MDTSIIIGNTRYNLLRINNTFPNSEQIQVPSLLDEINNFFPIYECQRINQTERNDPVVFKNYKQIAALNTFLQGNQDKYNGLRLANPRETWDYIQAINGEIPLNPKEPYMPRHVPLGLIITANSTQTYLDTKLNSDVIAWDIKTDQETNVENDKLTKTVINTKTARYKEIPTYPQQYVSPLQPLENILSVNPRKGDILREPNHRMDKRLHMLQSPTYEKIPIGLGVFTYSLSEKTKNMGTGKYTKSIPMREMKLGPTMGLVMDSYAIVAQDNIDSSQ